MLNTRIFLLFVLLSSLSVEVYAQRATRRICDTIHYEFVHDKIIIPVVVNGVKVKYIVDTGGQTGTMRENAVEMKAVGGMGSRGIGDVNGMKMSYDEAILSNVELSPNYKLAQIKSLIFPANGFFRDLGVVGILGSDAFGQAVITFDAREQIMVINYPYRPSGLKITDGVPCIPGSTIRPVVDVDFGGVTKPVLFDTGASGLLSLFVDDYETLKNTGGNQLLAKAFGVNVIGIGGFDVKNAAEVAKVRFDNVNFVGKKFTNLECVTLKNGGSLFGVDMLKYGKVMIDYIRGRFYFFPYDDKVEDSRGNLKIWNVGILPVKGHFEITLVWDSIKDQVELGDQVIRINGKDLAGLKQSQLEIDALLDTVEGDSTEIVILKDGKEKKVEISKF